MRKFWVKAKMVFGRDYRKRISPRKRKYENEREKAADEVSSKVLFCTGLAKDKPLVYVLRGKDGDMLVDTGTEEVTRQIDRWIRRNRFDIKWIFLTHAHFDHTWNAQFFKRKYGAKVILHEKDRRLFSLREESELKATETKSNWFAQLGNKLENTKMRPFCRVDYFLNDSDTGFLRELGFDADVVMLPGHTKGSMGIMQGKVIYAGDAVAAKSGDYYTMNIGEQTEAIFESEQKIFDLKPLVIAPGHGRLIINEKAFFDEDEVTAPAEDGKTEQTRKKK